MRKVYYILILIGAIIAIYADAEEQQNTYVLITGIVVLTFGLFRLSNTIPDRKQEEDEFVKTEEDKE